MVYLRGNPGRFFRQDEFDPVEMAEMLAGEAIRAGAASVRISRLDRWLSIESDIDWLGEVEEFVFEKIVPFPGVGPNSMFSEVLLMAFSKSVATSSAAGVRILKGANAGPLEDATSRSGRSVAFEPLDS
ncbi:hypothetical protein [Amycolatopsis sp. Hca4]|uniref:hypothetical protein n=1 Tax=Amycolatopsis sp. Hca4 TaxID=2742131 RepID=UPI0015924BA3|nr:hypothetical protein [Amycolatopsis sp. Hca4]QKV75817.1 hypothetical protein HUT10_20085 [Amycolatopsis sp. Hca4]